MADILADYHSWLYRTAMDYLPHDSPDVDDLAQEGRIAMWRALETYDESKGALPTWLTGAARLRMRALAHGKGQPVGHEPMRGRRPVLTTALEPLLAEDDSIEPEEHHSSRAFGQIDVQDALLAALAALQPSERLLVHSVYWEDLTQTETAARLGTTRFLVGKGLRRAHETLRPLLEDVL